GGGRHWITLRVDEPDNRQGIGARVDVFAGDRRVLHDEVRTDVNYRSKRDAWLHTGLDLATAADVEVRFRDGLLARWPQVAADQPWRVVRCRSTTRGAGLVVERGAGCAGAPRRWMPIGGGPLSEEPLAAGVWIARAKGALWVVDPRASTTREGAL
ncbi:MAG: UnbV, partial [Pseudomonadota bacterium]